MTTVEKAARIIRAAETLSDQLPILTDQQREAVTIRNAIYGAKPVRLAALYDLIVEGVDA